MQPGPLDEGRHTPGSGPTDWAEWWDFTFHTGDGDLGGYVRLGLWPQRLTAWFWAALVGDDRPLVSVVDHELRLPRPPGLDLRAEGLWTSLTCETPLEHWSIGLESFGVALEDPAEALLSGRGDRIALGLDLEWETLGPVTDASHPHGYHLACLVHGEVLVGAEVIAFEGWGGRSHVWGSGPGADGTWCATSGRLDDGTAWHSDGADGIDLLGHDAVPRPGRLTIGTTTAGSEGMEVVAIEPLHHAPVQMVHPDGRTSRLARSLCRYVTPDGRRGTGWSEWVGPAGG